MKSYPASTITTMRYLEISIKVAIAISVALLFVVGLKTPSLAQTPSISPSPSPTKAADTTQTPTPTKSTNISDKIKEKVQELQTTSKPLGFTGTITNKTDSTISIETRSGTKQVSLSSSTTVIDQKSGSRKTVTNQDLAIGDYVITMGRLESDNKTLSGKRIIIVSKPKSTNRKAFIGKATEIDKNSFKLETAKSGEISVKVTSKTRFVKTGSDSKDLSLTNIDIGNKLLLAGTATSDRDLEAKLVVILP